MLFRSLLANGSLDLDYEDRPLRDEMIGQSYKFSTRGSITMTSKDDMRKSGVTSPDSLDAAILSTISHDMDGPRPGDVVQVQDVMPEHSFYAADYW